MAATRSFIQKGRFQVGELAAGETKTARFLLQVKPGFKGESYPLELAIVDEPLEEFLSSKLDMPIADKPVTFTKKAGDGVPGSLRAALHRAEGRERRR